MNKVKRGPGRPPRAQTTAIQCMGISDTPNNEDNTIEFTYYDPGDLKQLFTLFKNLKCQTIYFIFTKKDFTIVSCDSNGDKLKCCIDCNKVMHYYCKEESLCMFTDRSMIQSIITNINKNINNLNITYDTEDSMLYFKYENVEMGKTETRSVLMNVQDLPSTMVDSLKYVNDIPSIKFALPIRDLKDTITDVICYADHLNIEKHGEGNLILSFSKLHTNNCETEYTNPDLIELVSNLKESESFNTQINTSTLKSLSISVTHNKITIMCFDDNTTILSSDVNNIIYFDIITKL